LLGFPISSSLALNETRKVTQTAKLVALPAASLRITKQLMRSGQIAAIEARMEEENTHFAAMLVAPEAKEAFAAFFQKRKPDFTQFR